MKQQRGCYKKQDIGSRLSVLMQPTRYEQPTIIAGNAGHPTDSINFSMKRSAAIKTNERGLA